MYTRDLKKLGRTTALAVAFALGAAGSQQAFAQNNTPAGSAAYTDVAHKVDALADIAKQIQMTKHTHEVLGLPQNSADLSDMKQSLKKATDQTAPRIILTPGLTAAETQTLIDQFTAKVGALPDYLAKVNHKTKLVATCTEQLIPPDDTYTVALATSIADCVAAKKLVDTPVPEAVTPPASLPAQKVTAPVAVTTEPPAPTPVKKSPAPEATVASSATPFNPTAPQNLAIEFGAAVLLLGGGVFGIRRMTAKKATGLVTPPANTQPPANTGATVQNDTPPKPMKKFDL